MSFSPRMGCVINGSFKDLVEHELEDLADHNREALEGAALSLKEQLRGQVHQAGLGRGLAKAWQSQIFPKGDTKTIHPAAVVFSKAADIHSGFDEGSLIRAKNGAQYLALPSDYVPPTRAGRNMKPREVEAHFNRALVFRPYGKGRKGGVLIRPDLVAVNKKSQQRQGMIMFFLVPQVQMKKLLDIDGAATRIFSTIFDVFSGTSREDSLNQYFMNILLIFQKSWGGKARSETDNDVLSILCYNADNFIMKLFGDHHVRFY